MPTTSDRRRAGRAVARAAEMYNQEVPRWRSMRNAANDCEERFMRQEMTVDLALEYRAWKQALRSSSKYSASLYCIFRKAEREERAVYYAMRRRAEGDATLADLSHAELGLLLRTGNKGIFSAWSSRDVQEEIARRRARRLTAWEAKNADNVHRDIGRGLAAQTVKQCKQRQVEFLVGEYGMPWEANDAAEGETAE